MQFHMSMDDSIALIVMHMPGISSSLFVSWMCLDSQSAMNSCGPDFTGFLCYTDGFIIVFFGVLR